VAVTHSPYEVRASGTAILSKAWLASDRILHGLMVVSIQQTAVKNTDFDRTVSAMIDELTVP
jgi:hypothetical protein